MNQNQKNQTNQNRGTAAQPQKIIPKGFREKKKLSPVPFYGLGICWVVYAILFPLYRLQDFFLLTVLSIAVFAILYRSFPGKTTLVKEEERVIETGDEQADKLIADGQSYLSQIREANFRIEDPVLSEKITRMEEVSEKIFSFVEGNPKKAVLVRKFMNYYLPTTLKLLNSYDKLSRQGVEGENITSTMKNIEEMMDTVVVAFEKQLDHLFQDEALDISTDITVLEGMLAQEGLS